MNLPYVSSRLFGPALCLWLICAATSGCATHADQVERVRAAFYAGRLEAAAAELDRKRRQDVRLRNDDVKQLDRAMIELASGRTRDAEQRLRKIRDRFDHLEQKSVAEQAASLLSDDNVKAYPGEDYERVLIRSFLALTNLMNGGEDAAAYALQITDKQQQIIRQVSEKYKDSPDTVLAYKQVPLGPYVRAMLAEESPLTLDEAARARAQVAEWAPKFSDGTPDIQQASYEQILPKGHGAVYVFALVGRGPVKEEVAEVPTQLALLVADRIVSAVSKHNLPPTIAPVKVPKVRTFVSPASEVTVRAGQRVVGQTATLVDVGEMARAQHEARYPYIIAEAVARRVLKKGVIYGAKEVANVNPLTSLAFDVLGVAWEATESADTRCWSLLPNTIQVTRVVLPAGEHDLELIPSRGSRTVGRPARTRIEVLDGRNVCVLGMFPDGELVGELLVSNRRPPAGDPESSEPHR